MKHQILNKLSHYNWPNLALIVISGILLAVPFVRYQASWLVFFSLLPILLLLRRLQLQKASNRRIIASILLVGAIDMSIVLTWMYQLNTVDLLQDPLTRAIFMPFTLGLMVLFFASGFLVFGWLTVKLKISLDSKKSFLLLPAAWVVGEFVRSVVFSVASLGEGGTVGMHWNFGALGLAASATPLVYFSRLGGLFGLSFVMVLINMAVFQLLRRKFVRVSVLIIVGIAAATALAYYAYRAPSNPSIERVGLVHLGLNEANDYQEPLIRSIEDSGVAKHDVVIFPEYSHLFEEPSLEAKDHQIAQMLLRDEYSRIITTRSIFTEKTETNAIVELNSEGQQMSAQGKTFLIPGGEYIPYLYKGILIASGNYKLIAYHEGQKTIFQSKKPIDPIKVKGVSYGVLACSGIIAPEYYRDLTNRGAEVLVNAASLSTMGIGDQFFDQAKQMARFQAVANARMLIQSARGKQSYIMSQNGTIQVQNKSEEASYLQGDIQPNSTRTVYTLLGEWTVLASSIGLALFVYLNKKR
ncbi:MAG: nitrilase-related carbon-nitrogen hydrolase [bacterium]